MQIADFSLPEFLLAEFPIKTGGFNDHRVFIYAAKHLSLIECVHIEEDIYYSFDKDKIQMDFYFKNSDGVVEKWKLIYHQNNVEFTGGKDAFEILNKAYQFFEKYLIWEDRNIDNTHRSEWKKTIPAEKNWRRK